MKNFNIFKTMLRIAGIVAIVTVAGIVVACEEGGSSIFDGIWLTTDKMYKIDAEKGSSWVSSKAGVYEYKGDFTVSGEIVTLKITYLWIENAWKPYGELNDAEKLNLAGLNFENPITADYKIYILGQTYTKQ